MQQSRNTDLTARSVVASLLLGMRRPELSGQRLVLAGARLGLSEGSVRVALSRMVAAGELTSAGGRYRLAGSLLDRHGRQEEGRRPRLRSWDGTWRLAIVGSAGGRRPAGDRAALRRRLSALRLAEWREGVWLRPDNLGPLVEVPGCSWWTGARPVPPGGAGELAVALFGVDAWAGGARALLDAMAATPADRLRPGFEVAAAVVRHLRDDPLLPPELLPAGWPGAALRQRYDRYEAAFQSALAPVLSAD